MAMSTAASSTSTSESEHDAPAARIPEDDFFVSRLFSLNTDRFELKYNWADPKGKIVRDSSDSDIPSLGLSAKFCPFKQKASLLAVGNEEGDISLHDTSNPDEKGTPGRAVNSSSADHYGVNEVSWGVSSIGTLMLLAGGASGNINLLQVDFKTNKTQKITSVNASGSSSVTALATIYNYPDFFVSGHDNGNICIWEHALDFEPKKVIHRPHASSGASNKREESLVGVASITSLFLKSKELLLSAGKGDKFVHVWDLKKPKSPTKSFPVKGVVTCIAMAQDSNLVYVSCMDNTIYCFDLGCRFKCSEHVYRFVGHKVDSLYIRISVSPCGRYLASGSSDGCVYIWSTNTSVAAIRVSKAKTQEKAAGESPQFAPVVKLHGHTMEVTCVDWSHDPDNLALVSVSDDSTHRVWRVKAAGELVQEYPGAHKWKTQSTVTKEGCVEIVDTSFAERLAAYNLKPGKPKHFVAKQALPNVRKAATNIQKPKPKKRRHAPPCPIS